MVESTREFSRIPLRLEVQLLFEDGSEVVGEGVDLSLKGTFCKTTERPEVGARCTVALTFNSGDDNKLSFYASGRVARLADNGLAVEFLELEIESFYHLRNLIRYNAPDPEVIDQEFEDHLGLKRKA
jgi:hypothetical protein